MLYGIGTDILKISRIKDFIGDDSTFIKAVYTEKEIPMIHSRDIPLNSYATRFAGKEAVFKSLNIQGDDIRLNEIEILENMNGMPVVSLYGNAKRIAEKKGISRILISLSYDTDYAIAYAAAMTEIK